LVGFGDGPSPSEVQVDAVLRFLQSVELSDVFDIVLVAICIYSVLLTIQKTRAVQIIQGVGVILLLLMVAHAGRLQTLSYILNWILVSLAVILPIIFQPELRRALMRLGQKGVLPSSSASKIDKEELQKLVEGVAHAAEQLSTLRHGALVVFERETGLEEFVEIADRIDGVLSSKLLIALFHPKTPLHDGAVVVRGTRLVAAGCYLPLSSHNVDSKFGTRHRAALGVSEQSDCVVLVVSEETGEIRLAHDGNFGRPMFEEGEVKAQLSRYLAVDPKDNGSRIKFPRKGSESSSS
jgi:diadenylate cyclase